MNSVKDFINFIGQDEAELLMCLSSQYPEKEKVYIDYILLRWLEFEIWGMDNYD